MAILATNDPAKGGNACMANAIAQVTGIDQRRILRGDIAPTKVIQVLLEGGADRQLARTWGQP
jgi:hypothetical protein